MTEALGVSKGTQVMMDFHLYYWSLPFRGQFIRAILAHAGKSWFETDDDTIYKLIKGPVRDMPAPFKGPPLLIDNGTGFAIAQMPAIVLYLGETLNLLPPTAGLRAVTMKTVNDVNDVLDEITQQGGRAMWTAELWEEFIPRFRQWMSIWEETGRNHGLTPDGGFLLGGDTLGLADIMTAILWSTMTDRFDKIRVLLEETAPMTAALARRVSALPPLAQLAIKARQDYGNAYCGGDIEKSMIKVMTA